MRIVLLVDTVILIIYCDVPLVIQVNIEAPQIPNVYHVLLVSILNLIGPAVSIGLLVSIHLQKVLILNQTVLNVHLVRI